MAAETQSGNFLPGTRVQPAFPLAVRPAACRHPLTDLRAKFIPRVHPLVSVCLTGLDQGWANFFDRWATAGSKI